MRSRASLGEGPLRDGAAVCGHSKAWVLVIDGAAASAGDARREDAADAESAVGGVSTGEVSGRIA